MNRPSLFARSLLHILRKTAQELAILDCATEASAAFRAGLAIGQAEVDFRADNEDAP